jgi:hypothetical protein
MLTIVDAQTKGQIQARQGQPGQASERHLWP